jgi:hypothetical protein
VLLAVGVLTWSKMSKFDKGMGCVIICPDTPQRMLQGDDSKERERAIDEIMSVFEATSKL